MKVCGTCGEDASSVSHKCDICGRPNHVFCGVPLSEGYVQSVRCRSCSEASGVPSALSIIQALAVQAERRRVLYPSATVSSDDEAPGAPANPSSLTADNQAPTTATKRAPQIVAYKSDRLKVVKWMQQRDDKGESRLPSKAVKNFPEIFRASVKANLVKAADWWKKRDTILGDSSKRSLARQQLRHQTRVRIKVSEGRGRKQDAWVTWLHSKIYPEFCRQRKLGAKISYALIVAVAVHLLQKSKGEFTAATVNEGRTLESRINTAWVQRFCNKYDIALRKQSSKLMCSPEKQESIERRIAYHLGQTKRSFDSGTYDEDTVFNMDETHFVINMDDGKTLALRGEKSIRYSDVVSSGEGMTMVVKIRGGPSARLEIPMLIF